ncbi:N-acetyl-gamma-glutamyl-phosphate reductase [hydrothermal vent metagenome]|uniref:N-acetyl-gamma-glutamyl-phosphate reductase n=1 Tax=hydrothermal vent metagenome TaxID=652676 RepID=A0A3B0VU20_9ZZZZ
MPDLINAAKVAKIAILGARGYVGIELIQLLDQHPKVKLQAVFSRSYAGKHVQEVVSGFSDAELIYQAGDFSALQAMSLDVLFLALPDGIAREHDELWVSMAQNKGTVIIDLSADYRFDDTWIYGQPETYADKLKQAKLIANPGCYATGIQMGLRPLLPYLQDADNDVPTAFGISGYSGAGTTPSDKNNPARLADNLLAYKSTGHTHEKEVSHVLQHTIRFMPHVAAHFRGIHLTLSGKLNLTLTERELYELFNNFYAEMPLIEVQQQPPEIQQISRKHQLIVGGFSTSDTEHGHFVLNVCLDNLMKGAATQAVQNMNLACASSHHTQPLEGLNYEQ